MFVSVVICTWNRCLLLRQTLERLTQLRVPPDVGWELLVVNNNCTDATEEVLAEFGNALPLRRTFESNPGLSHARNRAIGEARGDYLLWTDDDVHVAPDWLAEYARALERWPEAAYLGGPVAPQFAVPPPAWVRRHFDLLQSPFALRDYGPEVRPLAPNEKPFGANMLIRKDVLRPGAFDPRLGRTGTASLLGEEAQLFAELERAGHQGVWVGTARVLHYIPAERLTLRYIWDYFEGYGRTLVRQGDTTPTGRSVCGVPTWAVRNYLTSLALFCLLAPVRSRRWMWAARRAATSRGIIREARALRSRRGAPAPSPAAG
jgi:glycosyltransferase involved in cell wall biosynthesis